MTDDRLTPGHAPLCRGCQHQVDPFLPVACGRVRWIEHRHVKPDLQRGPGGVTCSDHVPSNTPTQEGAAV